MSGIARAVIILFKIGICIFLILQLSFIPKFKIQLTFKLIYLNITHFKFN